MRHFLLTTFVILSLSRLTYGQRLDQNVSAENRDSLTKDEVRFLSLGVGYQTNRFPFLQIDYRVTSFIAFCFRYGYSDLGNEKQVGLNNTRTNGSANTIGFRLFDTYRRKHRLNPKPFHWGMSMGFDYGQGQVSFKGSKTYNGNVFDNRTLDIEVRKRRYEFIQYKIGFESVYKQKWTLQVTPLQFVFLLSKDQTFLPPIFYPGLGYTHSSNVKSSLTLSYRIGYAK